MNVHYRAGGAEPGYIAPDGSGLDPNVPYTSSNRLWRTTDCGYNRERLSDDLTRADPMTLGHSGGPIAGDMNGPEVAQPADEIPAVGLGKVDIDVTWTGSDDGLVHVTGDGGESWKNVTPPDMPDFGRASLIDASAFDADTALRVGAPAAAGRLPAACVEDGGLRGDVNADRGRDSRGRVRKLGARGSEPGGAAVRGEESRGCT